MMYKELTIKAPSSDFKAFFQDGFYGNRTTGNLHKHTYTEIHLILNGTADFTVGDRQVRAQSGDMLVIPPKLLHVCFAQSEGIRHTAFQIDREVEGFSLCPISPGLLEELFKEIEACESSSDFSVLSCFIALLFTCFEKNRPLPVREGSDYGFLIQEFFTSCYSEDVHLSDLAAFLHLSPRQAERLVVEHTGKSFREELVDTRIAMAKHLIKTTDLPLGEIAQYVGYHSYAGFWKALKKSEHAPTQGG